EDMDKQAVYDVMLDMVYSVNVGWFKLETLLKEIYSSLNRTSELNQLLLQVNADFGRYEAKRLRKTLNIQDMDIDSLIMMLKYSHWFVLENIEVEKLTDKCFRMRTIDCTVQKALKRRGSQYYDCTTGSNQLCREAFFTEINQSVEIKRIFAPPESGPSTKNGNAISCEWEISIV
ncbi:MAG: hypothetical protein JXA01_03255, partial [Dehalococcoidia bacterium]|nr:hypothetical protein [Dehalococcoidia bacterium]